MVVDTISDFLVSNNYTKKFIAIDYGLKHIGMAISDPSNIISVPYGTFTETLLFEKIIEIIPKLIEESENLMWSPSFCLSIRKRPSCTESSMRLSFREDRRVCTEIRHPSTIQRRSN